jgi:hypothetical protein
VLGPQLPELLRRGVAEQVADQPGHRVGVLAERRVRGLREVLVAADPAPHEVRGQDGVLTEEGLQPQRLLGRRGRRGDQRRSGVTGVRRRSPQARRSGRRSGRQYRDQSKTQDREWLPVVAVSAHLHNPPPGISRIGCRPAVPPGAGGYAD